MLMEPNFQIDAPVKMIRLGKRCTRLCKVGKKIQVQQSAIQFTLDMYRRNNFTSQDVRYIQKPNKEFYAQFCG